MKYQLKTRELTDNPRIDINGEAYLISVRSTTSSTVLNSVLQGTLKYYTLDVKLPRLFSEALVNVSLGLISEGGAYITNWYNKLVNVDKGALLSQKDWFTKPGDQQHLFSTLNAFYTYKLLPSSDIFKTNIIIPTILEDFVLNLTILIEVIEFVIR